MYGLLYKIEDKGKRVSESFKASFEAIGICHRGKCFHYSDDDIEINKGYEIVLFASNLMFGVKPLH